MARLDPSRQPVIVGIGEIIDRPADRALGQEPLALWAEALRRADADAGGTLLARVDSLDLVNSITWPYPDPVGLLTARLGIAPKRAVYGEVGGNTPILFIHEAAQRIARGESVVAAVVGGEATHTATWARRQGVDLPWTKVEPVAMAPGGYLPARRRSYLHQLAQAHDIQAPITVYPLYENATAKAWGLSPAAAHQESARIWSGMSAVAAANPNAWMKTALTPAQIAATGPDNRPIAYPYPKLMVANPAVNQGGAVLITNAATARAAGIPESQLVYIWGGAAATEPKDWMERDQFMSAPAQDVVLEAMLASLGGSIAGLAACELYSCFPVVPKMARRRLGLAEDAALSTAGGLTFHGAPLNNYMTHAACGMVRTLRARPGERGLLYGQGGYVTAHHAITVAARPADDDAILAPFDIQAQADARRGPAPRIAEQFTGMAEVETFTVVFAPDGTPGYGAVVLHLPDGARSLARVSPEDTGTLSVLMDQAAGPIGHAGRVTKGADGLLHWAA